MLPLHQYFHQPYLLPQEFSYPIPEDYLSFLKKGDFASTWRKYYVADEDRVLEISDWFPSERIPEIYRNCRGERIIDCCHLPIFDSCGCAVALNCDPQSDAYGNVFLCEPAGTFDEESGQMGSPLTELVASGFTEIMDNLKTGEALEEMGIF